jgi:hypothetical protein
MPSGGWLQAIGNGFALYDSLFFPLLLINWRIYEERQGVDGETELMGYWIGTGNPNDVFAQYSCCGAEDEDEARVWEA